MPDGVEDFGTKKGIGKAHRGNGAHFFLSGPSAADGGNRAAMNRPYRGLASLISVVAFWPESTSHVASLPQAMNRMPF